MRRSIKKDITVNDGFYNQSMLQNQSPRNLLKTNEHNENERMMEFENDGKMQNIQQIPLMNKSLK